MPVIDREKCDGCGLCVSVCYCNALVLVDNVITVIKTEACTWCTECEAVKITSASSPGSIIIPSLLASCQSDATSISPSSRPR
ncbi:MAG: ATP-binding protein [Dehalococcoidia bacterium]